MKRKYLCALGSIAVLVLVLAGCANPLSTSSNGNRQQGGGQLQVSVAALGVSSVVPDIAALVSKYEVTVSKDESSGATLSGDQTTFEFQGLEPGTWEVSVEAVTDDNAVVGRGQETVEVNGTTVTTVEIAISPTSEGSGDIDLTVTWPFGLIDQVGSSTIAPLGGTPAGINSSIVARPDSARYVGAHTSGVYELLMRFGRGGVQVATVAVAVHVYDNVVTTETVALSADDIGQPPTAPTNLNAEGEENQVTLTWSDTSPVNDTYEIQRRFDGATNWGDIEIDPPLAATATEYVDTTAVGGTSYNYRIRATNSFGPTDTQVGWVEFNTVTPTTPQLAAPTLTPPDPFVPGGKIALATNKPSNVRYYYTKDGQTDPTFNSETFAPGPNTFAVWQYEGIVLDAAGSREIRVLARADGWLTSAVTTQEVTVLAGALVTSDAKYGDGTLYQAITNAHDGDTITFDGDYEIYLGAGFDGILSYNIDTDIEIDGGQNEITLDGGLGSRPFTIAANTSAAIRNIRIWRGADTAGADGGAIFVGSAATVTIENVHFDSNRTGTAVPGSDEELEGGAIYNDGGTVNISGSRFIDSQAAVSGGAIANTNGGSVTLRNSRFVDGRAGGTNAANGGAAIWAGPGTTTTIIGSLFAGNEAKDTTGGAIHAAGSVSVHGSLFVENSAVSGGAFAIDADGDLTVSNSVFADNTITGTSPFITGNVVRYNVDNSSVSFANCSFVNQEVYAKSITNSAFDEGSSWYDNSFNSGDDVPTYSIGPGLDQSTNIDQAAVFVREPGPGTDGLWGTEDDDWGDLRLVAGSPGIDAGSSDGAPADSVDVDDDGDTTEKEPDYAGNARVQNDVVDMGAVESPEL